MLSKQNVIKTIAKLPEQFSIDELVDKMILLDKIEKGMEQAGSDKVISDEELEERINNLVSNH